MRTSRRLLFGMLVAVALVPTTSALANEDPELPEEPVGPVNPNPPAGLKKYDYDPLTGTAKCWNYSCGFGWCCWVY